MPRPRDVHAWLVRRYHAGWKIVRIYSFTPIQPEERLEFKVWIFKILVGQFFYNLKSHYYIHYWNPWLCRVSDSLPSVFCRALGKKGFAESRTRQSSALGNELIYRAQDTRHMTTLGKDMFAECQTLGK
jgi:hypothetical protein